MEKINETAVNDYIGDQTIYSKDSDGNVTYSSGLAVTDHIPEYLEIRQKIIKFGKE